LKMGGSFGRWLVADAWIEVVKPLLNGARLNQRDC